MTFEYWWAWLLLGAALGATMVIVGVLGFWISENRRFKRYRRKWGSDEHGTDYTRRMG